MEQQPIYSTKKKKSEFAGHGAAVQLIGILVPIALGFLAGLAGLMVGIVAGLLLLVIGGRMAIIWTCGNCGNKLFSNQVQICPTCGARFGNKG